MKKLIIGLPKGSLEEATYDLFKKAGYKITGGSRYYFPIVDDDELLIVKSNTATESHPEIFVS